MSEELTRPSPHFKRYLVAALPLDCLGAESLNGKPCKKLRFETAGTVTVKRSSDGTSQTLSVLDGEVMDIACDEITSVVTVTAITVYW